MRPTIDTIGDMKPRKNADKPAGGISPEKLRILIDKSTYTQLELSRLVGVTQPMIARLLAGTKTNTRLAFAARLADALKCSVDDFLEE